MTRPIRIGNCSGFYGDRLSAMREMLEAAGPDSPLDVLTGDYLAELTMLILGKDTLKDAETGYAKTFLAQAEDCLGLALEKGVKLVSNAGGLNPAGLVARLREIADRTGVDPRIAYVEGDDLRPRATELGFPGALTANAYLGAFGIARALQAGADIVVTGRVTDASVVVGPAIAHHGWVADDLDALAGAVVAGHVIECGTQVTGGNFSGFKDLLAAGRLDRPLGFPIAEVAADGSTVVTKHPGTGGAVTVDTVTAQLVYEIQSDRYLNPDVTVALDSIRLTQEDDDRVLIDGVRGEAPPRTLKVAVNELGGYRNSIEMVITGLDIEEKAAWVRRQLEPQLEAERVHWNQVVVPAPDAVTEEAASVRLRCTVTDPQLEPVAKAFTGPAIELVLASYPGFFPTAAPARPAPFGVYRPEYVERSAVTHTVVHADGSREVVPDPTTLGDPDPRSGLRPSPFPAPADSLTHHRPLGSFIHARSGDKGGDANVGLWVRHPVPGSATEEADRTKYDARVTWLSKLITPRKVRELVPEAQDLDVEVYLLPNLGGVNVIIRGLLGKGVAETARFDPQAKGLGEWMRSRSVNIDKDLLA